MESLALSMATLGRRNDRASIEREKSLREKNEQRERTKKISEGRNFVPHLLQSKVINSESQHGVIHYSAATKKA